MNDVKWSITETPVDHKPHNHLYSYHAGFTTWRGDTFKAALLQWGISVSRHSPEDSDLYYITKIWRTEMSESGAFSLGTVEVDPRWEAE